MLVDLGTVPVRTLTLVLAGNPAPPADKGPEFGKASPIGLVVVLLLGIATVFLVRSMTKRIRRLPASFDDPAPLDDRVGQPPAASTPTHDDGERSAGRDPVVPGPAEVDPPGR